MKAFKFALAFAVLSASPALAATPGRAKEPAKAPAAADDASAKTQEKLICTREKSVESHMTKRVCKTQAQIDAERRSAEGVQDRRDMMTNRVGVIQ